MKEKIKSRQGFTISEMLVVVLIVSLMTGVVAGGASVVRDAYIRIVKKANAQTLLSTTLTAVSAELQSAENIETEDSLVYFDNPQRGYRMCLSDAGAVSSEGGSIFVQSETGASLPLITEKTKTDNLIPQFGEDGIVYQQDTQVFTVTVQIEDEATNKVYASQEIAVRPLNPTTEE